MRENKRIGRPTKKAKLGSRTSLGLRVTAELKARLDNAAKTSGRSQSQEAELRLTKSFDDDDILNQLNQRCAILESMIADGFKVLLAFNRQLTQDIQTHERQMVLIQQELTNKKTENKLDLAKINFDQWPYPSPVKAKSE